MRYRLLGPLEVLGDTGVLDVGSRKQHAVLAALLLARGQVVSTDRLVEVVWGGTPPPSALPSLQAYVSNLRRVLRAGDGGQPIERRPPGYLLTVDDGALDVEVFLRGAAGARVAADEGRWDDALGQADAALALWRGPLLANLQDEDWVGVEATGVEERRAECLETRVTGLLARSRVAEALASTSGLRIAHPFRERTTWLHLLALHRAGRTAEALDAYRQYATLVAEELGLQPGLELRELHAAVLRDDPHLLQWPHKEPPSVPVAATTPAPTARHVPRPALIGREEDLVAVAGHLGAASVATVTGPGGVGKTALAMTLARAQEHAFAGGVRSVWLSAVRDPSLVVAEVAAAVGLPRSGGRGYDDALVSWLADHDVLVLLDNCEHVLDEAAALVERLTARLPRLRFLATSREPLSVPGEVVYRLPPLAVPTPDATTDAVLASPGVRLFLERARAHSPDFDPRAQGTQLIAEVCRRIDGLPLAIELAAARVAALHLDDLAGCLDDLYRLLSRPGRGAEGRIRTLRATVQWSYDLLDDDERLLLRRLSVFAGSFDLAAAKAVCAPKEWGAAQVADVTARLVEKSLVVKDGQTHGYRMLETIRQFAAEQLSQAEETETFRAAHARWFLGLGQRAGAGLMTGGERTWLEQLGKAEDDLRVALQHLIGGLDPAGGLLLSTTLAMFWWTHGRHREGIQWLEAALTAAPDAPAELHAAGYFHLGFLLAHDSDDWAAAAKHLDRGITLASSVGEPTILGYLLCLRGECAVFAGDARHGLELAERGLAIIRNYPDPWGAGFGLWNVGFAHLAAGDVDAAEACFEETVRIQRAHGIGLVLMIGCTSLAEIAEQRGELSRARTLHEESLQLRRDLGAARLGYVHGSLPASLLSAARVATAQGDHQAAARHLGEALPLAVEMRDEQLASTIRDLATAST